MPKSTEQKTTVKVEDLKSIRRTVLKMMANSEDSCSKDSEETAQMAGLNLLPVDSVAGKPALGQVVFAQRKTLGSKAVARVLVSHKHLKGS